MNTLFGFLVHLFVSPYRDDYYFHHTVFDLKTVHDPVAEGAELYFVKPTQICRSVIPKRLSDTVRRRQGTRPARAGQNSAIAPRFFKFCGDIR